MAYTTAQLANELLMICEGTSVVQFSDWTFLTKHDTDSVTLAVIERYA